jgi:hypothetical protein
MSDVFTLDDLNNILDTEYGPFVFQVGKEKFEIMPILRLPANCRNVVVDKIKTMQDEEGNPLDISEGEAIESMEMILSSATDGGKGERLLEILGSDILKIKIIFEKWIEKTNPGEASASSE